MFRGGLLLSMLSKMLWDEFLSRCYWACMKMFRLGFLYGGLWLKMLGPLLDWVRMRRD
jgi:hypothetical protein